MPEVINVDRSRVCEFRPYLVRTRKGERGSSPHVECLNAVDPGAGCARDISSLLSVRCRRQAHCPHAEAGPDLSLLGVRSVRAAPQIYVSNQEKDCPAVPPEAYYAGSVRGESFGQRREGLREEV